MIKHSELNPKLIKLIDSEDFVALKKIVANNIFNQTCANCEGKVKPNNFKAIGKKEYLSRRFVMSARFISLRKQYEKR